MTTTQRLLTYTALVWALGVTLAFGQLNAPTRLDVVERVAAACPGLITNDHAFTDAVASELYRQDQRWGRNGKRGNPNDLSHDAIAYRNPNSPFGVSIVDIIGGAGGPNPQPAWIDQTQATIDGRTTGVWVAPTGRNLPCLSGGSGASTGDSTPPVVTPPAAAVDLTPILEAIRSVEARLSALEQRAAPTVDLSSVISELHALIGAQNVEHLDDIKQRIDAVRADTESTRAVVERARVLRY